MKLNRGRKNLRRLAALLAAVTAFVVLMPPSSAMDKPDLEKFPERNVILSTGPTTREAMTTAIQWMTAARERLRRVEEGAQTLEQKMQEIRLLNRAKWLLIEGRGMSEAEAHRFLEKQAMDRCLPKGRIAAELIAAADRNEPGI